MEAIHTTELHYVKLNQPVQSIFDFDFQCNFESMIILVSIDHCRVILFQKYLIFNFIILFIEIQCVKFFEQCIWLELHSTFSMKSIKF